MEKLYSIKDNYACIELQKEIYPLSVVKKALINFTENLCIKLEMSQDKIIVKILAKSIDKQNLENYIADIYNELLRETTRYDISKETKNIRELIIGRALYSTCIDTSENMNNITLENEILEKNYLLDEIATNWFDSNNKADK